MQNVAINANVVAEHNHLQQLMLVHNLQSHKRKQVSSTQTSPSYEHTTIYINFVVYQQTTAHNPHNLNRWTNSPTSMYQPQQLSQLNNL
eukprot:gene2859-1844_t